MALTAMAIAAALGVAKSELVDKPAADKKRKLAAETQRYSPWTGNKAGDVKEADPFGSALQFGATGAAMGGAMQNDASQAKLNDAYAARLNSGGSTLGYGKNYAGSYGDATSSPWAMNPTA